MEIYFVSKNLCEWVTFIVCVFILLGENSSSTSVGNEILVKTKLDGQVQEFQLNVTDCIPLKESKIPGKVISIVHNGNCVEVHEQIDCTGDYIIVKPNVPASDKLDRWNLNNQRNWIGSDKESVGAKSLSPCRPKCNETNIECFQKNKDIVVTLYSEVKFNGTERNLTVEGCKVFPKVLRNKVESFISDGSLCVELHERRDCSGDSIQIPRKTPFQLTSDLEQWGFSRKAIAISLCGYTCPNSNLKKHDEESYHRDQSLTREKITLFTQPQFEGLNETITFTENICTNVPEALLSKGRIESIVYNPVRCYFLFENTDCNYDKGNIFCLNNTQDAQDLRKVGWRHEIKSISRCPIAAYEIKKPRHVPIVDFAIFLSATIILLLALVLCLQIQRKSPKKIWDENGKESLLCCTNECVKNCPKLNISKKMKSPLPILFNVQPVNKPSVGRHKELTQLQRIYSEKTDKLVLISGLGGIGKTELAKKFVHDVSTGKTNCIWFNGESFHESLIDLAERFKIRSTDEKALPRQTLQLFQDVFNLVRRKDKLMSWLIIIDDVEELNFDVNSYLPLLNEMENTLTILISRNNRFAKQDWKFIEIYLEEWESSEANVFVKISLPIPNIEEDIFVDELCEKCCYFPLALQLAVSYILQQQKKPTKEKAYSISDYLLEIDSQERNMSDFFSKRWIDTSNKFAKTTFVTWNITIAKIKEIHVEIGYLACEIVEKIAYLDPHGIPVDFLEKIIKLSQSLHPGLTSEEKNFKDALTLLKMNSLITVENCEIKSHRLLQQVIRRTAQATNRQSLVITSFIDVFKYCPFLSRSEMTQVLSVLKHSSNGNNLMCGQA